MESYKELSDLQLFKRIKKYDSKSLSEIYDRYSVILFSLIKRIVGDKFIAEEILVEVFAIVWKNIEYFNPETGNPYVWLITLTRNKAIDSVKRNRETSENLEDYTDEYEKKYIIPVISKDIDILDLETAIQIKPKIEKSLTMLTDTQKYVLYLAYYEGYTIKEIAAKLKMPVTTVRTKITNSIYSLKEKLLSQENG